MRIGLSYSTIHFNQECRGLRLPHRIQSSDFVESVGNELLSAKPGIDAHDAHQIEVTQYLFNGGQ